MADRDFDGLSEFELIRLLNKKKKKYCALMLGDLEDTVTDETIFKIVRKIVLDNMNGYTRGIFSLIGIDIEGNVE